MARSGRKIPTGVSGRPTQTGQADTGQVPLRPKVQYRPRGQSLDDLPNTELMPGPEQSRQNVKPRQVDQTGASQTERTGGVAKPALFGALGALVVVAGLFLALTGGKTPNSEAPAGGARVETSGAPIETPAAEAQPAPDTQVAAASITTPETSGEPADPLAAPDLAAIAPSVDPEQASVMGAMDITAIAPFVSENPAANTAPELWGSAPAAQRFSCAACIPYIPELDRVAVFSILSGTVEGADMLAKLRTMGAREITETTAALPVSTHQVRFYNADDLAAATAMATQFGATLVDLTWYDPPPAFSKLDLWLAE